MIDKLRTPRRRSCPLTSASGGPSSTSTAPSGTCTSVPSPCPTSRNVTRSPVGGEGPSSGAARHATSAATARAARTTAVRRPRGDVRRTSQTASTADVAIPIAGAVESLACGRPATARAQSARYAASHPSTQLKSEAASGSTGWSAAALRPSPSRGATAGAASALLKTEYTGTEPNWKRRIGAVATPHAVDTATAPAATRGNG